MRSRRGLERDGGSPSRRRDVVDPREHLGRDPRAVGEPGRGRGEEVPLVPSEEEDVDRAAARRRRRRRRGRGSARPGPPGQLRCTDSSRPARVARRLLAPVVGRVAHPPQPLRDHLGRPGLEPPAARPSPPPAAGPPGPGPAKAETAHATRARSSLKRTSHSSCQEAAVETTANQGPKASARAQRPPRIQVFTTGTSHPEVSGDDYSPLSMEEDRAGSGFRRIGRRWRSEIYSASEKKISETGILASP